MEELKKLNLNDLDKGLLIQLLLIGLILLISAAYSSTFAEQRGHKLQKHFFLGLILPIAYPLFITFTLKTEASKKSNEQSLIVATTEQEEDLIPEVDIALDINDEFFRQFPTDDEGLRTGPFIFETENGMIQAQAILDIQDTLLVLETKNSNNGTPQRLRLPYDKIISCNT